MRKEKLTQKQRIHRLEKVVSTMHIDLAPIKVFMKKMQEMIAEDEKSNSDEEE